MKIFIILFLVLFFNSCVFFEIKKNKEESNVKFSNGIYYYKNGSLEYKNNIPFLKLNGDYFEMGEQYGVLLKKELNEIFLKSEELEDVYKTLLPWYQRFFLDILLEIVYLNFEKRIPSKYLQELEGISKGSGISYKKLVLAASMPNIADPGCTSVIVNDKGRIIHGRNFDFMPSFLGKYPVFTEYTETNGNKYSNIGIIGYTGTFDGFNENISISLNYGRGAFNNKYKGTLMGFRLKSILSEKKYFTEIDSALLNMKNPDEVGWMISVCDYKNSKSAIYEVFGNEKSKKELSENSYIYALNAIFDENKELSPKYLKPLHGASRTNNSRKTVVRKYANSVNSIDKMIDLLGNTEFFHYDKFYGSGTYSTISNEYTLFSIIFDLKNSDIYFANNSGYASLSTYNKYNLSTREFSFYKDKSTKEINSFRLWFETYQELIFSNNHKKISKIIDLKNKNLTPRELSAAFYIWQKNKKYIDGVELLYKIEQFISLYPDYYFFYALKASYYKENKDYLKAIEFYEKSLNCSINFDYNNFLIYNELHKLCKKEKLKEKSAFYFNQKIRIYNYLKKLYYIDKKDKKTAEDF